MLSLHVPANRKQSLENTRHEARVVLGPLPRDRLVIQTTEGRSSDIVKQKSSCGSKKTPEGISRWPNGKDITSPAPSTPCPYPVHQPLLSRQLASPSQGCGRQDPSCKHSQLTAAGQILSFSGFTSSQIPRGGQLTPAVKIAHGSPSKQDDSTDK